MWNLLSQNLIWSEEINVSFSESFFSCIFYCKQNHLNSLWLLKLDKEGRIPKWSQNSNLKKKSRMWMETRVTTISKKGNGGMVLRWQRNRTGRLLSPSKIPQKNISMLSKLHKTTSEFWQRTSGTQKTRSLSSKTGRKKYKRQKKRQRRWGGSSVLGREF